MNDHTIFIRRKTRVDASVLILGVVNIKSVFSYFTPSPRERGRGRSSPFNLRWGISKKVALQPCLFTQKPSYLPWWGLGESGGTYIQGKNKNKQTNKQTNRNNNKVLTHVFSYSSWLYRSARFIRRFLFRFFPHCETWSQAITKPSQGIFHMISKFKLIESRSSAIHVAFL